MFYTLTLQMQANILESFYIAISWEANIFNYITDSFLVDIIFKRKTKQM